MRKLAILAALAVITHLAVGQQTVVTTPQQQQQAPITPQQQQAPRVTQAFTLKNADAQRISNILLSLNYQANYDRRLGMVVVSADRAAMPSIADVIQRLDAPSLSPKNVEVTMYIVEAAVQGGQGGLVPTGLEPVAKQMQTMFGYQSFRLLDSPMIRGREGELVSASGVLMLGGKPQHYDFSLRPGAVLTGKQQFIRLDGLVFTLRTAGMPNTSIRTDGVEFAEDQKAVIGKTGLEGERTLLMVVSGRIID